MVTTDMEAVAKILNHPKVYGGISDDSSLFPYTPSSDQLCLMNEEKTAVAQIAHVNGVTCMVHIAALPDVWGRTASFVRDGIRWVFENTPYSKIIGFTPENNRAAICLAKRCGFKEEGRIKNSFLKDWVLQDQIVFGMSKYD